MFLYMQDLRVLVLRGGPSDEYAVSMKTGAAVLDALRRQNYFTKDIVVTKQGEWLEEGRVRAPEHILQAIDVVFIGMHGAYAEDGEVQKIFERDRIPFTGSRSLPSAIAFNKSLTKETLKSYGILTPEYRLVSADDLEELALIVDEIKSAFGPEYVLKPVANGSSIGTRIISANDPLLEILANYFAKNPNDSVLIEEYITGKEATSAVLENFRGQDLYIFPTVELAIPNTCTFYDNEAKYGGQTEIICPSRFSLAEREQITSASALAHEKLGLSQYSRSDFMLKDGQAYFLEVNTLPGMTATSLFPRASEAVGLDFDHLVSHLVQTAAY